MLFTREFNDKVLAEMNRIRETDPDISVLLEMALTDGVSSRDGILLQIPDLRAGGESARK